MGKFVRPKATNFRGFLSSLAGSEDVLFSPEDLLITAIDFTLIAIDVGFGLLRMLMKPGLKDSSAAVYDRDHARFCSNLLLLGIHATSEPVEDDRYRARGI